MSYQIERDKDGLPTRMRYIQPACELCVHVLRRDDGLQCGNYASPFDGEAVSPQSSCSFYHLACGSPETD
jgi:hypothetical protein